MFSLFFSALFCAQEADLHGIHSWVSLHSGFWLHLVNGRHHRKIGGWEDRKIRERQDSLGQFHLTPSLLTPTLKETLEDITLPLTPFTIVILSFVAFFFFFFKRERESTAGGAEGEGESQEDPLLSAQPDTGLIPPPFMTSAEIKSQMLYQLSHSSTPLVAFLNYTHMWVNNSP